VLQQGEYTTVGGRTPIKTNVRIVAATNKDLRYAIQQGSFREDLFFRLNVVPLRLPPLRERTEDIPDLVRHFFQRGVAEGLAPKTLDAAAIDRLRRYPWPGNIRELENLTRRIAALYPQEDITEPLIEAELGLNAPLHGPGAPIGADLGVQREAAAAQEQFVSGLERHVAELFRSYGDSLPPVGLYQRVLRNLEVPLIAATLTATRGNQIKAAEILGLNRNTLRKKIRDLDLRGVRGVK
jgi:two-component system nitrogen regulation response regulator GlnG